MCTFTGERYYLFDKDTLLPLVEQPTQREQDLYTEFDGQQPPNSVVLAVPQGTVVVAEPPFDNPDTDEDESEGPGTEYFVLHDRPALSGDDITNPEQNFEPNTNQPNVTFDFTDEGREAFANITREIAERGRAEAPIGPPARSRPTRTRSTSRSCSTAKSLPGRSSTSPRTRPGSTAAPAPRSPGASDLTEAQDLAEYLRIGALPVELKLISQSTVSATLGEEALDQGLKAGLIGLALVLLFLVAYYRLLGVVAALGLLVYAIFFYALIELIPITLTLPGIAGLILTIGVAADSNIVIFERIKEEVRAGRSMPSSIARAIARGSATIIDANVITLITAFILFVLATSGVKGFAFTLGVGTIVSLLTAVVFTQAVLGTFGSSKFLRSPRLLGAGEQRVRWHFDFTGASRWFFSISGAILAIGALSLAINQLNLGIDFESGTRITVSLGEPADGRGAADDAVRRGDRGGLQRRDRGDAERRRWGRTRTRSPGRSRPTTPPGCRPCSTGSTGSSTFRQHDDRPHLRRAGRSQRRLRDPLLAARDRRLRGDPLRAQVRDPGDDRPRPRHPDHGGRLLAVGPGGDERNDRRLPHHPRLLDVRHDHRLRPDPRERAASAARDLLPDRQPLDERGLDPIADHRPLDRVPDRGAADLRRRHAEGLRLRDDGRGRLRYLLVDLHRLAGADRLEGARARSTATAAPRSSDSMGYVPAFPEDNVVERVEGEDGEPDPEVSAPEEAQAAPAATPAAVATAPSRLPEADGAATASRSGSLSPSHRRSWTARGDGSRGR